MEGLPSFLFPHKDSETQMGQVTQLAIVAVGSWRAMFVTTACLISGFLKHFSSTNDGLGWHQEPELAMCFKDSGDKV